MRTATLVRLTLCFVVALTLTPRAQGRAIAEAGPDDLKIIAPLSGAGVMRGRAVYEERAVRSQVQQRLKVEVQHAVPGRTYLVRVNGAPVGRITVGPLGRAEVHLRSHTDDQGRQATLPRIRRGDRVTVGPVGGVFR